LILNDVAMSPSNLSLVVAYKLEERTFEINFSDERHATQYRAKVGGSHRHATTASLPSPDSLISVAILAIKWFLTFAIVEVEIHGLPELYFGNL
jgi:hypothetical protein